MSDWDIRFYTTLLIIAVPCVLILLILNYREKKQKEQKEQKKQQEAAAAQALILKNRPSEEEIRRKVKDSLSLLRVGQLPDEESDEIDDGDDKYRRARYDYREALKEAQYRMELALQTGKELPRVIPYELLSWIEQNAVENRQRERARNGKGRFDRSQYYDPKENVIYMPPKPVARRPMPDWYIQQIIAKQQKEAQLEQEQREREVADHNLEIANLETQKDLIRARAKVEEKKLENQNAITDIATKNGMTPDVYQNTEMTWENYQKRRSFDSKLNIEEKKVDSELKREEIKVEIEANQSEKVFEQNQEHEHKKKLNEIEADKIRQQEAAKLEAVLNMATHESHTELNLNQQNINNYYKNIEQTKNDQSLTYDEKTKIIKGLRKTISALEAQQNELRGPLRNKNARKNTRRGVRPANAGAGSESDDSEASDEGRTPGAWNVRD